MKVELTSLYGLNVYTDRGTYVGRVDDIVIDPNEKKISGLAIGSINTNIFDLESKGVIIPYRWITAIGDIVLMKEVQLNKRAEEGAE
ncbi:MAG: PRC-barrel domain-containing protein [Halobacteriota archaeon]|nr:PRC-barrel domain-containing protein [Halobacteriota archaeon]